MIPVIFAMAALLPVQDRVPAEPPKDTRMTAIYRDFSRGIHLERKADGKVMLKAPEPGDKKGETQMWEADSPEEFKEKYPEIVHKYDLDSLLRDDLLDDRPRKSGQLDAFEREMKDLTEKFTREWRRDEGMPDESKPQLGLLVTGVPDALRSQLKLKEKEGVLVLDVIEDGAASKAGMKKHDIVTRLNGATVTDLPEFVQKARESMEKDGAKLSVIREGKAKEIEVKKVK
jgi:C-terminal processing protease CtpA/Prc